MCGSRKGLKALVSPQGYEHYNLKELRLHSERGCLMCSKILVTLEDNEIEDDPRNPGWLTFFALDRDRRHLKVVSPAAASGAYPPTVKKMCYLGAEGFKRDDFVLFLLCSSDGELNRLSVNSCAH